MRNILFICNTYFQLIVTMQLSLCYFSEDAVYIILTDHSSMAKQITERLQKAEIFSGVYFMIARSLDYREDNAFQKLKDILDLIKEDASQTWNAEYLIDHVFDELIYYNFVFSSLQLFNRLSQENPNLICSRMEEGILSYDVTIHDGTWSSMGLRTKAVFVLRKLLGKANLQERVQNFYCFYPELYHGKLHPVAIEKISAYSPLRGILAKVFQIDSAANAYPEKYIFFTSVGDFEGGVPIGEYNVVEQVARLVGKENLLVKQHPRDPRTLYRDNGFHVDSNSAVPWEAIQLSMDFHDHVLLTATSTAPLSSCLISDNAPAVCYLYPLCNVTQNSAVSGAVATLERLLHEPSISGKLQRVHIIRRLEEILDAG